VTASYPGDGNFAASTSAGVTHTVGAASTTTTITGDTPEPSLVGQAVTVTYTVTSTGGTPTGTVTVSDGTDTCIGTVAAGTCSLTPTTAGAKTLVATYAGNTNFAGSASTGTAHAVNAAGTTSTISGQTPNPSAVGEAVSFSFTVVANAPGSGTPTGTVTVSDGTQSCGASVAGGSCSIAFSSTGGRTVTASYPGDGTFASSTSVGVTHTVNVAGTTTTITGHTPDPSVVAQGIAVTFTVTSTGGTPTGNVTVDDGTVNCTGTVAQGGCTLTPLTPGLKTLVATYAGNTNFAGSVSTGVSHTVNLAGPPSSSQSSVTASPSPITASKGASASTITVTVRDAFGNAVSGVTVVLSATGTGNTLTPSGTTDGNGEMTGTLSSTDAGTKTITATVGSVTIAAQPSVTVDPAAASHLVFTTQPADVQVNSTLSSVVVTAYDAFGNAATGFTGDVLIAIGHDGSLLPPATLGGTLTVAAGSGVATFGDLTIDQPGVGYTLVVSAGGLGGAESDPFTVLALFP
jgi:hypothetical protein